MSKLEDSVTILEDVIVAVSQAGVVFDRVDGQLTARVIQDSPANLAGPMQSMQAAESRYQFDRQREEQQARIYHRQELTRTIREELENYTRIVGLGMAALLDRSRNQLDRLYDELERL